MKNREKYRDEILNSVFRGKGEAYCEFVKKNVLPNLTDCTNGECEELYACGLCRDIFAFWLDEEYIEPPKPEVDWSKVPVDTLVRVRYDKSDNWLLRYFSVYEFGAVAPYVTWVNGSTSVTSGGIEENWKYCELVEDEDDGSN